MSYPTWYTEYRQEAFRELEAKAADLDRRFSMTRWAGLEHHLEDAELILSDENGVRLRATVEVVGADADEGDWSRFEDEPRPNADGYLDEVGWELAAIVVKLTGAVGAYRAPAELGAPFLVIRSISPVAA